MIINLSTVLQKLPGLQVYPVPLALQVVKQPVKLVQLPETPISSLSSRPTALSNTKNPYENISAKEALKLQTHDGWEVCF